MSRLNWITLHFLSFTLYLTTIVMFILSSISRDLECWLLNHTSIYENSKLKTLKNRRNI